MSTVSREREVGRRSHRKSRNGCANCKVRKVKCDESRPLCSNCIRHGVECSYGYVQTHKAEAPLIAPLPKSDQRPRSISSHNNNSSPENMMVDPSLFNQGQRSPPQPSIGIQINMPHIELMHNYSTSSYLTLSRNPILQTVWRVQVPQLGLQVDYVMCAILAFSSLHLAYFKPDQKEYYTTQALALHSAALRSVNNVLPDVNDDNCAALWAFSVINCSFSFARPKEAANLFSSDDVLAEWLLVFRGIRIILDSTSGKLFNTPLAPIFTAGLRRELAREDTVPRPIHPDLVDLVDRLTETVPSRATLAIYTAAIVELSKSFYMIQDNSMSNSEANATDAFIWLFRVSDAYLELLSKREPEALVVFAHFCTVLRGLDWAWWMNGWSFHLMASTYRILDHNYRVWLQWPIEQIGWLPP